MDKIVITIQSNCAELFSKQLVYLKEFGIKIIDYHNTSNTEYLLSILKLKEYHWIISINESTFISDYDDILLTIEYMKKNNIVIGGISDGGVNYINNGSPYVFNRGFNIFNIEKITININSINTALQKWDGEDLCDKITKCDKLKRKVFLPYKLNKEANLIYNTDYPIYIYLLENYKNCFFSSEDTAEKYYTTCPPINIYSPNNKIMAVYCGYGEYYTQEKLKIDISVNNVVSFNNRTRLDYFYNKTCINQLTRLSINHNAINYYYHNYIDLYRNYFNNNREVSINILTIGNGNYLNVLKDYFINAKIYTVEKQNNERLGIDKCDISCVECFKPEIIECPTQP